MFQDRFKSETVEDDSYLLIAIRYIHQNPIKAGICKKLTDYKYSSYIEFLEKQYIVDSDFIFEMFDKKNFFDFNNQSSNEKCLDVEDKPIIKVTDEQAQRIIEKYSKCKNVTEFQALDIKTRDNCMKKFRESGLSIRQISRLTGISYYLVQKA